MPKAGSGFGKSAEAQARKIISGKDWTVANKKQAIADIREYYENVYRNGDITFETDAKGEIADINLTDRAVDRAEALATALSKDVVEYNREAMAAFKAIRKAISGTYYFSQMDRSNIPNFRDYSRSSENRMRLTLDRSKTSVDTVYEELTYRFPGYFPSSIMTPSDRLQHINSTLSNLKANSQYSVSQMYGEKATEDYTGRIMMGILDRYQNVWRDAQSRRKK